MSLFSKDDYAGALGALLPTGRVWPLASKTVQAAVLRALGSAFQRSDADAINLIAGAFPPTATSMLPEWEATLGLPDDCAIGEIDGVSDRQRMVVAKLISTGGLNRDYYIRVAAALGYTITITQFRPSMCGMSVCGDALNGDEWPFTWQINAPQTTIKYALSGASYCGDSLSSWGNKQLECAITKIAPSHLRLIFSYA
ncbi:YmfQ family protein [[Enterobacter] lignolyticus]|uniref:Phage tail protein n=1 Tax=[Enterobacter] lignolyticus TaxID=1334193 RepID=A0A806X2W2_9ENTR|nr:YmfQ family protein [[Enterobacter] lignolyticus]ALR75850.1 phage tail protein [[Enterobacter] lignolyticus]